jgi:large subunit ribosomal protein L4
MASISVIDTNGASQGSREVSDEIFGVEFRDQLVHEVVTAIQAAQRQGTHKVKVRHEVSGGGAKPFKQKGTGRARQGSIREPHMRGGGIVHGPQPRDYTKNITRRARRQALCSVLSERLRQDRLSVLSGLKLDAIKTKPFARILEKVSPEGRKTLLVTDGIDANIVLSARNIPRIKVCTAEDLSVLDAIGATRIVLHEEAVAKLEERLS